MRKPAVVPPNGCDPTKARTILGWDPQKTSYEQLVEIMAKHDRERAKREKAVRSAL